MKYYKVIDKGNFDSSFVYNGYVFKFEEDLKSKCPFREIGSNNDDYDMEIEEISEKEYIEEINKNKKCKGINLYDLHIDDECIDLCNRLNYLPGVKTRESCCGHLNDKYIIILSCSSLYSMSVIARSFDRRYSGTEMLYNVALETVDCEQCPEPQFIITISSKREYDGYQLMNKDVEQLCDNILYWSNKRFDSHFQKKDKDIFNRKYLF